MRPLDFSLNVAFDFHSIEQAIKRPLTDEQRREIREAAEIFVKMIPHKQLFPKPEIELRLRQYEGLSEACRNILDAIKTLEKALEDADEGIRLQAKSILLVEVGDPLSDLKKRLPQAIDALCHYKNKFAKRHRKSGKGPIGYPQLQQFIRALYGIYEKAGGKKRYSQSGSDYSFRGEPVEFVFSVCEQIRKAVPEKAMPETDKLRNYIGDTIKNKIVKGKKVQKAL